MKARDFWEVCVLETPNSFGACHCMVYLRHKKRQAMILVKACRSGQERMPSSCERRPKIADVVSQIEEDLDLPLGDFCRKYDLPFEEAQGEFHSIEAASEKL